MRKQIKLSLLALGVIIMTSISVSAQNKASVGLKAEANSTFYKFDTETAFSNSSPDYGGGAGLFFKYEFKKWFALQSDLMLHYRNSEMTDKLTDEKTKLESYDLELPVYAIFQANTGAGKFFVGLGPYMGYGIKATNGETDMYEKDLTGKAPMRKLKYGAAAIVGYDFGHFQINASYISRNGIGVMTDTSPLRPESISLGIGFSF